LVLYEVLSGRRAFSGDSSYAVMDAIVKKEPPPLQTSPTLERIVKRCLEKNPADRYRRMWELKVDLVKATAKTAAISDKEPQPSIAVLPFVNMSGDKEQEYFSDGLAEEIINALTKIPGLKVAGRTSSFYFRDKDVEFKEIGQKLDVEHILEGSVRKAGNRLRVTAQLINVSDGFHLWSERYDRDMTDIFAIQDEISQAIAEKLRVQISGDRPLVEPKTKNPDAYNLFLKGRYYLTKFTPEGFAKGKDFFEQAVSMDPHYAMAWHGLAEFYFEMGIFGYMEPKAAFTKSMYAINKVLELDQTIPEVHALVGTIKSANCDWEAAEKAFNKALDLGQQSEAPEAWLYYSIWYLVPHKRNDEAFVAIKKGLDLDPLFPFFQIILAMYYYLTRQWDQALEQCRYALELHPDYYIAYQYLGFTYLQKGMNEEGIRFCKKAAEVVGKGQWNLTFPAIAYATAGQLDEANRLLRELHDLAEQSPVSPTAFAWIYCSMGEIDKGLYWFEKAFEDHDGLIVWTHLFPIYDPIRSHPRYKALLKKMNLEP
jgi:TolB-like protein/Tfp pilus assembly protein PilF